MKLINNEKGIISLIVIMTIGLFALATVSVSLVAALNEFEKERDITQGNNTLYASEAAAREGVYQYRDNILHDGDSAVLANINEMQNESVEINYLDWQYSEVVAKVDNAPGYNRKITYVMNKFPEGDAFSHAVYAANELDVGGNTTINGNAFSNGNMDVSGSAEVNGNASSPLPIADTSNINGDTSLADYSVPAPQIDLASYAAAANLGGTYYTVAGDAENFLKNKTKNAIVYVADTGNTKIQNTNLTGSIVTSGDLEISSGGTFTASSNHIAMYVNGDLKTSGNVIINGIVYVTGAVTSTGTVTINGSLVSSGTLDISGGGNLTINYDDTYIGDLKDIVGLVKTSASKPEIKSWKEE